MGERHRKAAPPGSEHHNRRLLNARPHHRCATRTHPHDLYTFASVAFHFADENIGFRKTCVLPEVTQTGRGRVGIEASGLFSLGLTRQMPAHQGLTPGCGLDSGIQVAAVCQVRKLVVLLFGAVSSTVWAQKGGSSPSLLQETGKVRGPAQGN